MFLSGDSEREAPANAPAEVVHYYVRDDLGHVVGLTDAGEPDATPDPVPAKLVEGYVYDPYGRTTIERWNSGGGGTWERVTASRYGNPFGWTGQRYDAGVGLYAFLLRTYSPELGRWLQRDPAGFVDGVNVYEYVGSGPTGLTDQLGLTSVGWPIIANPDGTFSPAAQFYADQAEIRVAHAQLFRQLAWLNQSLSWVPADWRREGCGKLWGAPAKFGSSRISGEPIRRLAEYRQRLPRVF